MPDGRHVAQIAAARHGRAGEPVLLNDGTSVVWRVDDLVVKTTRDVDPLITRARRGHRVASWLHAQGLPTTTPLGWHEIEGFGAGVFEHIEHVHDFAPEPTATLVTRFHALAAALPVEVPRLHIDHWYAPFLADALAHGLADVDLALVEQARGACVEFDGPTQPIHADLHQANVLATAHGHLLVDFDLVGLGPVDWDLSGMRWRMTSADWARACEVLGVQDEQVRPHEPTHWLLATMWLLSRHDAPRREIGRSWLHAGYRHALDLP